MPGFNGTGPVGLGPMTGGGRGLCFSGPGRRSLGRGRGMGRGEGGFIRGQALRRRGSDIAPLVEENEFLKGKMDGMERELAEIKSLLQRKND